MNLPVAPVVVRCRTCGRIFEGWLYESSLRVVFDLALAHIRRGHLVTGSELPQIRHKVKRK